jgi:hypothetical protein
MLLFLLLVIKVAALFIGAYIVIILLVCFIYIIDEIRTDYSGSLVYKDEIKHSISDEDDEDKKIK